MARMRPIIPKKRPRAITASSTPWEHLAAFMEALEAWKVTEKLVNEKASLTYHRLAKSCGVGYDVVKSVCAGNIRSRYFIPSPELASKLARALGMSCITLGVGHLDTPDALVCWDEGTPPSLPTPTVLAVVPMLPLEPYTSHTPAPPIPSPSRHIPYIPGTYVQLKSACETSVEKLGATLLAFQDNATLAGLDPILVDFFRVNELSVSVARNALVEALRGIRVSQPEKV